MDVSKNDPTEPPIASDIESLVAMLKLWSSRGLVLDESQQKESDYLNDVLKTGLSQVTDEAAIRDMPRSAARLQKSLTSVWPTLSKFSQVLAAEIKTATIRTRSLSFVCGVSILSDDLLGNIFELVVQEHDGQATRATVAVQLSRVCRRFRSVAFSTCSLWDYIYGSTTARAIHLAHNMLCLERSAEVPLEIFYSAQHETIGAPRFMRFMKMILPHVGRWKSFTLEFRGDMEASENVCNAMVNLEVSCAPRLQKLGILSRFYSRELFDASVPIPFSKWALPNLEEIDTRDLKMDIAAYPALKRMRQGICINFPLATFFTELMALKTLRYLYLGLFSEEIPQDFPRLDLPSVTELDLYLRVRYTKPFDAVLAAINCPNVTSLTFRLLFSLDDEDLWGGDKMEVTQHYVRRFFSIPDRFRVVRKLTFSVTLSDCVDAEDGDLGHMLYALPLENLPSLQHLYLKGSLRSLQPHSPKSYAQDLKFDDRQVFPAIETITVNSTGSFRIYDWLDKVMKKLDKQGVWEQCFKYLVLGGKHMTANNITKKTSEVITKSEIIEWISSNAPKSN